MPRPKSTPSPPAKKPGPPATADLFRSYKETLQAYVNSVMLRPTLTPEARAEALTRASVVITATLKAEPEKAAPIEFVRFVMETPELAAKRESIEQLHHASKRWPAEIGDMVKEHQALSQVRYVLWSYLHATMNELLKVTVEKLPNVGGRSPVGSILRKYASLMRDMTRPEIIPDSQGDVDSRMQADGIPKFERVEAAHEAARAYFGKTGFETKKIRAAFDAVERLYTEGFHTEEPDEEEEKPSAEANDSDEDAPLVETEDDADDEEDDKDESDDDGDGFVSSEHEAPERKVRIPSAS